MNFLEEHSGDLLMNQRVPSHLCVTSPSVVVNGAFHGNSTVSVMDTQLPHVVIEEQPQQRGFRYRYECEGQSHGGLQGEKTERNSKSYPSIRVKNYTGPARVEVSLVTDENPPRIHAHKLVGKNCEDGVCRMDIPSTASVICFPFLCIQHVTRKKAVEALLHRIKADRKLKEQLSGAHLSSQPHTSAEDNLLVMEQAQEQARSMALNKVRLQFQVFLPDAEGRYLTMLPPVVSQPIYDSKAPGASTLKICRMDKFGGCCTGNEEVFLLCEKVQKEDIQVCFVEYDSDNNVKWQACGNFSPLDVHRQFAIVFRTPPYIDTEIDRAVNVMIMLQRKSDGAVSEPKAFTYYPQNRDKDLIARKRRKKLPLDSAQFNGDGGPGSGQGGPGGEMGNRFEPLGPWGFGGGGGGMGGQSHGSYQVIMPNGNIFDQLNVLPATVEQAVKEEFSRSPETTTASEFCQDLLENPLGTIVWPNDLEMDAAPSLRHPSQLVTTSAEMTSALKPQPDSCLCHRVKEQSGDHKDRKSSGGDKDRKGSGDDKEWEASDKDRKDSADDKDRKGLEKEMKESGDDKDRKGSSGDDKDDRKGSDKKEMKDDEHAQGADDPQTSLKHAEANGGETASNGGQPSEPGRSESSLSRHCGADAVHRDQRKLCEQSETAGITRTHTQQRGTKQQHTATLIMDSRAAGGQRADKEHGKAHGIPSGGECGDVCLSSTQGREVTVSEGVRSDEGFSDASSVKEEDREPKNSRLPPHKSSKTEDAEQGKNVGSCPVRAATAVVKRVMQRVMAKTVLALRDYSETGDPRYLLLVQRHLTSTRNENGDLPLHLAVINNQTTALRHLLTVMMSLPSASQVINTFNYIRQTALHLAAIMQQPQHVELLLQAGADPTLADRDGNTPAHLAVLHGSVQCLQSLVKYLRPSVTLADPFPELDYLNYDGYSPVHLATLRGSVEMLRLLVHGHADVDVGDGKSGRTALHHAVENDDLPVAGFLLMEAKADVNARCFDGNTPLHVACCRGLIGMVALLMTAGAQTTVENEEIPPDEDRGEEGEGKEGKESVERGSRRCRRGLQPRDYAAGKDRLRILRMLLGDTASEGDGANKRGHSHAAVETDLLDDPDLTVDPGIDDESCLHPADGGAKQDEGLMMHKLTYDSSVAVSLASQTASILPEKEKLSDEENTALSKLLDPVDAGKDVLELAARLGYDTLVPALEVMASSGSSPTQYLLNYNETYGSVSKLRECLLSMERDDAVKILDSHL
ncbi:nuclear factor NF-kappa-B p105 subunit-like [Babylonia areolata]|uniref:nuclear factor NF-kappa-B p105 subunit-like n=1 Tax=Babylonia areolata TaxID=304850 RepID=UPI003FD01F07